MHRRHLLTRFAALTLGPALGVGAGSRAWATDEPASGLGAVDFDWLDERRGRPVPARLYLPTQASRAMAVPLVVFSHGLGGSRLGYRYLALHGAQMGMASLHLQHVGSDSTVWRGSPLELVQRLQSAAQASEALARVQDLRFGLDQLLSSPYGQRIDVSRIAVAGHSYGANTAMLLAGARVEAALTGAASLRDERVRAAILISAPPIVGQGPAAQVLGTVSMPTLHITSLDDTINIPGYRSTIEDRIAIFEAMTASPRTLAVYNTGGHSIFTDRTTRSGPQTSARIKSATQALCTIFLRQTLRAGPPMSSLQGSGGQAPREPGPQTLAEPPEAPQDLQQWRLRHQDVLDRFVSA